MRRTFIGWVKGGLLLAVAGGLLFGDQLIKSISPLGTMGREMMAVFRDPGTQWMVFLCAGIYLLTFSIWGTKAEKLKYGKLKGKTPGFQHVSISVFRGLARHPGFWLCGLFLIVALGYAFDYERGAASTQALVLLAGVTIGKGARLWANWGKAGSGKRESIKEAATPLPQCPSSFEAGRESETENVPASSFKLQLFLGVLLLLLAAALFWHPEGAVQFQYRGLKRWSGPWDNPNIFGMLMGMGVVSGAWLLVSGFKFQVSGLPSWKRWVWCGFLLGCTSCCGVGLLKSYSRGAWLGVAIGFVALGFQLLKSQISNPAGGGVFLRGSRFIIWLRGNRLPLFVLLASLVVLTFWQFRQTEWHPARRAFSVGNKNDFSWRNRVAAWEGSLAMMADRPVAGYGWNQPDRIYDQFYRPPKVAEGMAIQLNHFFTLGMSIGVPALICFGIYVGLALRGRPNNWLQPICRAGAVVLLVGLWFDGGLFNLATAAPLWALLELGLGAELPSSCNRRGEPDARFNFPVAVSFALVLLLTGLLWAKARDPFHREWLSLRTSDGERFSGVAVMPDRGGPFPVVVWCHGSGGSVDSSGETLQQFAALGLAAIGIEYNKANQTNFDAQFATLLDGLAKNKWARSDAVAWVGSSLGAQRELSFLARHPERKPAALVRLNGGWVEGFDATPQPPSFTLAKLPVWMAHGENDEVFPVADARRVAEALRAAGAAVRLDVFPGRGHGFGEDQPLLVRAAAEFCAREMGAKATVLVNVRPGLWYYWIPAGLFGGVLLWRRLRPQNPGAGVEKPARWLRTCAAMAAIGVALVSAAHLALPLLRASPANLEFARPWCVRSDLRGDFDWLALQSAAKSYRIQDLLEHLNLAALQRWQFAAALPENDWREYVLSPWVEGDGEDIAWRRELWEWMSPRVRRETDAEQAARVVARELRRRIVIEPAKVGAGIREAWHSGKANPVQREQLLVAMLRSTGIAARVDVTGHCECWTNGRWRPAPPAFLP